ncbi:MAG: 23S rRNA pseudouridine(2604) synthase RluF [Clostridiaceae bacterium]|nr:23S rRNA pseudouridine(2604) synthase RluF [Clostridiaceae bacterium]
MDNSNTTVRLNKYIADSGFCSRREADKIIADGRVTINDQPTELGQRVGPDDIVKIDEQPILPDDDLVYLAVHKPTGITCTTDERRRDNIVSWLDYPKRIFPVGRLDRDSEGLIFMTNDGSIVNRILRAGNYHEKEYIVTVDRPYSDEFLQQMAAGVSILDTVTRPCKIKRQSSKTFRIILTQGFNRQIRRMCEALGYEVTRLVRVRIMHVTLNGIPSGQWRYLTPKELKELKRLTSLSADTFTETFEESED